MDDTGRDRYEALVRVRPSQKGESEEENRTGKKKKKRQVVISYIKFALDSGKHPLSFCLPSDLVELINQFLLLML